MYFKCHRSTVSITSLRVRDSSVHGLLDDLEHIQLYLFVLLGSLLENQQQVFKKLLRFVCGMRCERTKCICYERFGNLAPRAMMESLIYQVYSWYKSGIFDREMDRILPGQLQIQVCRLHMHAGTHILSLEITNKLLILEN